MYYCCSCSFIHSHSYCKSYDLVGGTSVLGKMQIITPAQDELQLICQYYGRTITSISTFLRLQRDNEILFSQKYTRVKVRNSYTVTYQCLLYGQILYFVCLDRQPAAVIVKLDELPLPNDFLPIQTIVPVERTAELQVVNVQDVKEKCVFIQISDSNFYVVKFPCVLDVD